MGTIHISDIALTILLLWSANHSAALRASLARTRRKCADRRDQRRGDFAAKPCRGT